MAHPSAHTYRALADELLATGIVSDPWLDGRPRFAVEPLLLAATEADRFARAAEAVAAAYEEAARLCAADPWLVERFFPALTPFQHLMWSASGGAWHGIARADVFTTADGTIQICELNCDTPSGEAEAVLLNAAVAPRYLLRAFDPNVGLERAFVNTVSAFAARVDRGTGRENEEAPPTVGIVYPTELVEDLSMILMYRRWLEARGCCVVTGSPFNLARARDGGVALFSVPCDVIVRHYKTDWWSEREPARDDEAPFDDAEPLAAQLGMLVDAELTGRVAVMNPWGAVLLQNKRTMALMWEAIDRFSPPAQAAIRAYLPYTARLEALAPATLAARAEWVLKSDYGCEGAEVVIGADTDDAAWADALRHARRGRWIAQRYFRARRDGDGRCTNVGVYVVGGEASGFFSRVHAGATDYHATTVATLIEREVSRG
ncbi:MAG TPA: glutathionylspermidine synthase family protein [Polyangia bacterium]|nr:glutathionylspermidine synthase family protein [Polyangia bacterium]